MSSYRCVQCVLFLIFCIMLMLTPYLSESTRVGVVDCLISNTSDSLSLWPLLPLIFLSSLLSAIVPRKRCLGFTHSLLSQRCRTHSPTGIVPRESVYINRCVEKAIFFLGPDLPLHTPKQPYPLLIFAPLHSQQESSSDFLIFPVKRSISLAVSMLPSLPY